MPLPGPSPHARRAFAVAGAASALVASVVLPSLPASAAAAPPTVLGSTQPRQVRIGAPDIPVGVSVTTSDAGLGCVVATVEGLSATSNEVVGGGYLTRRPGDARTWTGVVHLDSLSLQRWGASHTWVDYGFTQTCAQVDADTTGTVTPVMVVERPVVDLRANSVTTLTVRRTRTTVTVKGTLRSFDPRDGAYHGWGGRPVVVERLTAKGWVRVRVVRADGRGNVSAVVVVPRGTRLRLRTDSSTGTWGSLSPVRGT